METEMFKFLVFLLLGSSSATPYVGKVFIPELQHAPSPCSQPFWGNEYYHRNCHHPDTQHWLQNLCTLCLARMDLMSILFTSSRLKWWFPVMPNLLISHSIGMTVLWKIEVLDGQIILSASHQIFIMTPALLFMLNPMTTELLPLTLPQMPCEKPFWKNQNSFQ